MNPKKASSTAEKGSFRIMPQEWFEMIDIKKRSADKQVWIPLRKTTELLDDGEIGNLGYTNEFFGVGTIAVDIAQKATAEKFGWMDIGISHSTIGHIENDEYVPAYVYKEFGGSFTAEHLVMHTTGNAAHCQTWHLNQDLVVTLGLIREEDSWVSPSRGYEVVAKLERDQAGCPMSLEINAFYLKDYLRARNMALYLMSYRSRVQIVQDANYIRWDTDSNSETAGLDRWQGHITEIHEGGEPYGSGYSVTHISRTDVDYDEDVPSFDSENDENTKMEFSEGKFTGDKLYRVWGEFWRNEWVEPAAKSSIVLEDDTESTVSFITDTEGTTEKRDTLEHSSRWLWFKPSVCNELLTYRGSSLNWHTRDTGAIGCSPGSEVRFGVNDIGYINVFAKDIVLLPEWQQKIWVGHNVAPDGKVSVELLMSQMEATPASSHAPEYFITRATKSLDDLIQEKFGIPVFRQHTDVALILARIHRFRATTRQGLFELAKDLIRISSERIDVNRIKKIVKPKESDSWGTLKALERLLAQKIGDEHAYELLSPLWGIYNLRQADSHLPSSGVDEAFEACGIDQEKPPIIQGFQLIHCYISCFAALSRAVDGIS